MKEKFINKHLFVLQRKSNKNLLIIFSLIVSAMLFMVVALYPMMTDIVKELPSEIGDMITMTSIASYFNTEALEMWIFIVCIYVAGLAINITTKEFKNGSYDMIYTLNISRPEIIRTKLLRLVVNTIYINLISFVVALISLLIFGANDFKVINLIIYAVFALLVTLQVGIVVFSLGLINKEKFNNYGGMAVVLIMFLFTTISITVYLPTGSLNLFRLWIL